MTILQRWC